MVNKKGSTFGLLIIRLCTNNNYTTEKDSILISRPWQHLYTHISSACITCVQHVYIQINTTRACQPEHATSNQRCSISSSTVSREPRTLFTEYRYPINLYNYTLYRLWTFRLSTLLLLLLLLRLISRLGANMTQD